jgi:hypothetical protein
MAEPMPPKHRVSLTEVLTIDDLINLISMKARTRAGRIITGVSSVVLLAAIIVGPIVIRSNHSGAGTSSTPTIPVVTVPPITNTPTAFVQTPIPVEPSVNFRSGEAPHSDTPTTAPTPKTTAAPPATTAPATTPATFPQTTTPPVTSPPTQVTFPPPTFPQATTPPPTTPPQTTPPLTVPSGGITAG